MLMPVFLMPGSDCRPQANTLAHAAVASIGAYAPNAGKPRTGLFFRWIRQWPGRFPACFLLLALTLVAGCSREPPEQALRGTIAGMQAAAETREVSAMFEHVAQDFSGPQGMDRETFRRYVLAITMRNQSLGVQLGPLDVKLFGERATVAFTAGTRGGANWFPDRVQVYQVETGWRMDGGEWKLVSARWEPKL
jgi:hypothetical protein